MNIFAAIGNGNLISKSNLKFEQIFNFQHFSRFTSVLPHFLQDFNGKTFSIYAKKGIFSKFSLFGWKNFYENNLSISFVYFCRGVHRSNKSLFQKALLQKKSYGLYICGYDIKLAQVLSYNIV